METQHPSTMNITALIVLLALHARLGGATHLNALRQSGGNDGVRLAIGPRCGPLSGSFADVSAGVVLSKYKTIVAFGVRPSLHCISLSPVSILFRLLGFIH